MTEKVEMYENSLPSESDCYVCILWDAPNFLRMLNTRLQNKDLLCDSKVSETKHMVLHQTLRFQFESEKGVFDQMKYH